MLPHFQKFDILPQADFNQIVQDKDEVYNNCKECLTINKDGTITKSSVDPFRNDKVIGSKNLVYNISGDIETFRIVYPESFVKSIYKVQQILKENGVNNTKCCSATLYRKNFPEPWHKHLPFLVKPTKFWIGIYYIHPNWNTEHGGQLVIGGIPEINLAEYECISNSLILHHGMFGHGVKVIKPGFHGNRDLILTHWISEDPI